MALQNVFGDLNLEVTQLAILAELAQKLEAGQSVVITDGGGSITVDGPLTDAQLRALAVAVSGTVALDATTLAALESISVTVIGTVPVSGPLTDVQLRATPVPISGTVSTNGLTDTQLRAAPVPISGTVTATGTQTDALTDTQLRATPVPVSGTVTITDGSGPVTVDGTVSVGNFPAVQPVSDNGGSLTTDGTFDERYSGGKSAFATTIAAAGDTTLVTPAIGMSIRVVWVSAIPSSDNNNANRVRFKFGAGGAPFYEAFAVAHWEVFTGGVNVPLVFNAQTSEAVSVTVHYREI